jgi:hypothetical protein
MSSEKRSLGFVRYGPGFVSGKGLEGGTVKKLSLLFRKGRSSKHQTSFKTWVDGFAYRNVFTNLERGRHRILLGVNRNQ